MQRERGQYLPGKRSVLEEGGKAIVIDSTSRELNRSNSGIDIARREGGGRYG
jgi:hypothetical protein